MGTRTHRARCAGREHPLALRHSDHVGGNGLLQVMGAGVAASSPDAQAIARGLIGRTARARAHLCERCPPIEE